MFGRAVEGLRTACGGSAARSGAERGGRGRSSNDGASEWAGNDVPAHARSAAGASPGQVGRRRRRVTVAGRAVAARLDARAGSAPVRARHRGQRESPGRGADSGWRDDCWHGGPADGRKWRPAAESAAAGPGVRTASTSHDGAGVPLKSARPRDRLRRSPPSQAEVSRCIGRSVRPPTWPSAPPRPTHPGGPLTAGDRSVCRGPPTDLGVCAEGVWRTPRDEERFEEHLPDRWRIRGDQGESGGSESGADEGGPLVWRPGRTPTAGPRVPLCPHSLLGSRGREVGLISAVPRAPLPATSCP